MRITLSGILPLALLLPLLGLNIWLILANPKENRKLEAGQQELAKLQSEIEQVRQFQTSFDPAKIQLVESFFVDKKTPIDLVAFLEQSSQSLGIKIQLTVAGQQKQTQENVLSFNLQTEGTTEQLLKFIKLMELAPYLIEIQNFSLAKTPSVNISLNQQTEQLNLAMNFSVKTK